MPQPSFLFFRHPAPPEPSTLSLPDALPISFTHRSADRARDRTVEHEEVGRADEEVARIDHDDRLRAGARSEEHTSELQSQSNLVCRLLLEKKNRKRTLRARCRAGCRPGAGT